MTEIGLIHWSLQPSKIDFKNVKNLKLIFGKKNGRFKTFFTQSKKHFLTWQIQKSNQNDVCENHQWDGSFYEQSCQKFQTCRKLIIKMKKLCFSYNVIHHDRIDYHQEQKKRCATDNVYKFEQLINLVFKLNIYLQTYCTTLQKETRTDAK